MKKTKIMASFLSLTLSMTSIAITPVSVSAESIETPAIMTNEESPVITTTSGPVEPVKTTVTENTTAVTTTESVKTECSYSFNIKFTDEDDEPIENINAKLVQHQIEWTDDEHYVCVGDAKTVAEWNTSEVNPFISEVLTANFTEYRYTVVTDELPDGYVYYSSNKVEQGISGYLDGEVNITIKLKKGEITENTTPLSGTYSLKINVMDKVRNIPVENLDCELFNIQTGAVAASWNTSEKEEMYIENLEYSFDKPDSYNGNITYAIRITNLPENYRFFYGKTREQYGVSGFSLEEFKNGTDISCTVYLEDTSEDAPKYTYVTTPQAGTAVTETTTTTAEIGTSTTPIVTENNENNEDLDIIFKDNDLNIDNGTEKAFEYEITGTNDVSFLSDSTGITVSNTFENGKGTLTVKAKGALEGKNFIKCFLGTGENSITKTITITVNKPTTFHCPECGRDVPIEDKVSGALRAVCKDCYEKGQSVGSTVPPETSETVTTTSTTVTSTTAEPVKGDANCDGDVNMSDAVIIMQSLANPAKYGVNGTDENHITEQGKINGDIAGNNDGITNADALAIQKKLLKLDESSEISTSNQAFPIIKLYRSAKIGESQYTEMKKDEIVKIETDYNPIMSDMSGIGILLEFDSKDYPITLSTNEGHFTTWDKETGVGVVSNVGKTYDIGNKGYVFWTPDSLNFDEDFESEIIMVGDNNGKNIELGKLVVNMNDKHTLTAVLK